ncbi:TetR/AcrR family transcriptional regulator [Kocuria sp. cx-455]|uniref:TetR/AcrR family transcriptional regulator n=1 Tax=Kocuria sp. cx-455 TaxID=2771377 RepID=UPI003D72A3D9
MSRLIPESSASLDRDAVKKHLRLLWRPRTNQPERPGPRPRITTTGVVSAAISRADSAGLENLTMRELAADLGVKPMTLYSHVPDKASLLALMTDQVFADSAATLPHSSPWRDQVRAVMDDTFQLYSSHPWLLTVHTEQPVLGPGFLGRYERQLQCLQPLGLNDVTLDATLTFVSNFARSAAADLIGQETLALSGRDWWEAAGPTLEELVSGSDYPLATRVGTAAGRARGGTYDAGSNYSFGTQCVLAGLGALVDESIA